jgi:hypothetical protein
MYETGQRIIKSKSLIKQKKNIIKLKNRTIDPIHETLKDVGL